MRASVPNHLLLVTLLLQAIPSLTPAASTIATRLEDPKAAYLAAPDGQGDDTAALQAAIDKAENNLREGILFVPSGRYRLTHTVYVWPGVRVIGYGPTRPVFQLPADTPGFQKGVAVMVMFTGGRARTGAAPAGATPAGAAPGGRGVRVPFPPPDSVPPNAAISDAGAGTFYSAMSNIDFEIGDGNPAAVAIR
jgi:hypothetical protein